MRITINDIARACGVSVGVVSRIINEDASLRVRPETRKKVVEEIERTGYSPNLYAKKLANYALMPTKDLTIGYLTYKGSEFFINAYFDKIVEGITEGCSEGKYELLRFYVDEAVHLFQKKMPLHEKKLDGLILFGRIPEKMLQYLLKQARYVVSVDGEDNENVDFVGTDLVASMNMMLDYIKTLGHEEIGMVTGGDANRDNALFQYADKLGIKTDKTYRYCAFNSSKTAYEETKARLNEKKPPKLICCMNDEMAIGVMKALSEEGYRIPEDVSVTGHDDIFKSNYCEVPLTTVHIYKEEIGRLVSTLLIERIKFKRKIAVKMFVPCKLVIRKSTKKNKQGENLDDLD